MTLGAYTNVHRTVMLLRGRDQAFGLAVESFVESLGLRVVVHEYAKTVAELVSLFDAIERNRSRCGAVVEVLESDVIVNEVDSSSGIRFAQPSAYTLFTAFEARRAFGNQFTIGVVQSNDPVSDEILGMSPLRLHNDKNARKDFKSALVAAKCTLAAEVLQTDQDAVNFHCPQDWWNWEFQDPLSVSPSFAEFLVDAAFNRSLTQSRFQEDARQKIKAREPLDLKYHYIGWRAAQSWTRLIQDPQYGHTQHMIRLRSLVPEIIGHISTEKNYNYISLGPGDGQADVFLLPELSASIDFHSIFLVDVSIELLQIATNALIEEVIVPQQARVRSHIRAVLGDFEDSLNKLAPVLNVSGIQNIFLLLGFTIGNGNEQQVLANLSRGMKAGDYLLFDARLHPYGPEVVTLSDTQQRELKSPYDTRALRAFAFGPVEEAGDYTARVTDSDVEFHFLPQASGAGFSSSVPGAINLHVECSGIYENPEFCRKLGINLKRRISWKQMPPRERLRLATITFYDFEQLSESLKASRVLRVVWERESREVGVFLLERTNAEP